MPLRGQFAGQIGGEDNKRSQKLRTRLAFGHPSRLKYCNVTSRFEMIFASCECLQLCAAKTKARKQTKLGLYNSNRQKMGVVSKAAK